MIVQTRIARNYSRVHYNIPLGFQYTSYKYVETTYETAEYNFRAKEA